MQQEDDNVLHRFETFVQTSAMEESPTLTDKSPGLSMTKLNRYGQEEEKLADKINADPRLSTDLYSIFLKRIEKNLHLVIAYSPTGERFKDRLVNYQSFLMGCTVVWMTDF
mmetsp:Transcript_7295/g.6465  ORF Transcript_7295/g.6465 Transcript_7295/m.6465 type:complete len:111 (+) Transcript_7295:505-837(+)